MKDVIEHGSDWFKIGSFPCLVILAVSVRIQETSEPVKNENETADRQLNKTRTG